MEKRLYTRVLFLTKDDACDALKALEKAIIMNGCVSVAALYDILEWEYDGDATRDKGWYELNEAKICESPFNEWVLELPNPQPIGTTDEKELTPIKSGKQPWNGRPDTSEDLIHHPAHYQSETGLEALDVIEAFTFNLMGIEAVYTSQVFKYMCRWKKKNGLQDLQKAQEYLTLLINHVEKLEKENS